MTHTQLEIKHHSMKNHFNIIKPKSIFQKLFLFALKNMENGELYIYLNQYEGFVIGKPNEKEPARIYIKDDRFFKHCILFGEIGFAETYIYEFFETDNLYRLLEWFVDNSENSPTLSASKINYIFVGILNFYNKIIHWLRPNTIKIAEKNISKHYDLSNQFYQLMLDRTMTYSSGIFLPGSSYLEDSQQNKYERICRKLNLRPNLKILEIGCGWGGFAKYVIENYDCEVMSITISKEQYRYVKDFIESNPNLKGKLKVEFLDFRYLTPEKFGKFDRIVSIEMAEALGIHFFDIYFKTVSKMLKDDGLAVIQYINYPEPHYKKYIKSTDFIQKYIFPGGQLLSHLEVLKSLHRVSELCLYDLESFGLSYAKTLNEWKKNFIKNINNIIQLNFDSTFLRKWYYYLNYCEVGFASRYINVSQILLSKSRNLQLLDSNFF